MSKTIKEYKIEKEVILAWEMNKYFDVYSALLERFDDKCQYGQYIRMRIKKIRGDGYYVN